MDSGKVTSPLGMMGTPINLDKGGQVLLPATLSASYLVYFLQNIYRASAIEQDPMDV